MLGAIFTIHFMALRAIIGSLLGSMSSPICARAAGTRMPGSGRAGMLLSSPSSNRTRAARICAVGSPRRVLHQPPSISRPNSLGSTRKAVKPG